MRRRGQVLMLMSVLVLRSGMASATTVVPMSLEDLARSSALIVIGTVDDLTAVQLRNGRIATIVRLAVDEVVKGDVASPAIALKESGGSIGRRTEIVFGAPVFHRGERALLFLSIGPDGSLRTTQLGLGKFRLELDANGMPQAGQSVIPGATVIVPSGSTLQITAMPLADVLDVIRGAGSGDAPAAYRLQPPEASDVSLPHEATAGFTLFDPAGRFFEPDEGIPFSFLIDQNGDAILGLTAARQAVNDAFATWSNVAGASIVLQDSGLTADTADVCPGPNKVVFDDPLGEIGPPTDCTGTLAMGGFSLTLDETKIFSDTTFARAECGRLTFANGWQGCQVWNQCNVAEIATHELGHAIGLDHSSERNPEPDPLLRDATMYFLAHFDGRCASVRQDDINGVSFIYPTAIPPTITTADPLPDATVSQSYNVTLTATGGTGSFRWILQGDGLPGLHLGSDGVLSGIPQAPTISFPLYVKTIDAQGDSHTKLLDLTVYPPGDCAGDCNHDDLVTIDEILTGTNIVLGARRLAACRSFDTNGDGTVTINEILSAVDAALNGC